MVRITITHINNSGPIQFPAKKSQLFIQDKDVPRENRTGFYKGIVDNWLKEHPGRQLFGDFEKDIVGDDDMCNGNNEYGANKKIQIISEEEL